MNSYLFNEAANISGVNPYSFSISADRVESIVNALISEFIMDINNGVFPSELTDSYSFGFYIIYP